MTLRPRNIFWRFFVSHLQSLERLVPGAMRMAAGPRDPLSFPLFIPDKSSPALLDLGSQAIRVLMGILIFLTPFYSLTTPKEFCFYLSILILLALTLFFKRKIFSFESPFTLPFLLFISWACFDLIFALNKENSLHDIFFHLIKYLAVYYLVINFFNSRKHFLWLSWVFVFSAAVFSFGALIYFYLFLGNSLSTLFRIHNYVYGYFHFWTVFASLLSIQMLFEDLGWQKRLFLFLCLSGMIFLVILSQTRSALIAIALGLVIYFFSNKRVILFLLVFGVISFFMIASMSNRLSPSTIHEHANIRIGITYLFFEMWKDYPLAGIGYGMQTYNGAGMLAKYNGKVPPRYRQEPPVPSPHNLFTDITVRLGVVGLGFFLFLLGRVIQIGWKLAKDGADEFIRKWALGLLGALAAFLVNAMAMDATFGVQAVVFYSLLAMMTLLWRVNKTAEISSREETKAQ